MDTLLRAKRWVDGHRDVCCDLLRMYFGVALLLQGISFVARGNFLLETMHAANLTFLTGVIAHYVVVAHIVGGFGLAIGLLTRGAALAQVPVLIGAIMIHRTEGLFTAGQQLEFSVLVLALLLLFTAIGAGRLSVDHYIAKNARDQKRIDQLASMHPVS